MKTRFLTMKRAASKAFVCSITLLALLAFVLPQAAQASTAANTVIKNTATVNYDDTAGNAMPAVSDSVEVTVAFVCAPAAIIQPADQNTDPNTNAVYNYTLTSQANGPDTYTIGAAVTAESSGITSGTSTATPSTTSIILGATTAAATAAIGATAITVPNDLASDISINGIEAGDTVVIGGNVYEVDSIVDNGATVGGTSTITLKTALSTAVAVSDPIYEQKAFTVTVDPGTVTLASDQTIDVTTTATGTGGCSAVTDDTITTVQMASLTIEKTADVSTAKPGDTITYTIEVENTGSSNALNVIVTDPLPLYTTYVANSTTLNGITVNGDGATSPLIAGLLVDADASRAPTVAATGTLASGEKAVIIFQVTVN